MLKKIKESYLVSGILFLSLAYLGGRFFEWGKEELAFLLLIYLVVIIGIRLDELSARLADVQARLTDLVEHRSDRKP